MTIIEKKSNRKKLAILYMVKNGEYSIGYALSETEKLSDEGKLTEADYEELAEYLEGLLTPVEETTEEPAEEVEDNTNEEAE